MAARCCLSSQTLSLAQEGSECCTSWQDSTSPRHEALGRKTLYRCNIWNILGTWSGLEPTVFVFISFQLFSIEKKMHACFFRHGSHVEGVRSPHKWNCKVWIFHNVPGMVSFLLKIHSSGRMSQSWNNRPWEDGVFMFPAALLSITGLHRWRLADVAAAMLIQNISFIKRINSILCPERFIDSCKFYATGSTNGF